MLAALMRIWRICTPLFVNGGEVRRLVARIEGRYGRIDHDRWENYLASADADVVLRAAIALKRETGGVPDRADAADWTEAHATPRPGVATVIYHSVFLQYPPKAIRDRIRAAIAAAGAQATTEAPLAWLSMEPNPQEVLGPFEVKLTLWPTGQTRRLALVHPHGAKVRWLG